MPGKVTLKDIAREVGLSTTAVSLVLNDRPCKISDENRRRIHEAARRKRYIPNQTARSLVTQHTRTVGLVVPNIESRFFSSLAHRLETGCRGRGYALFITNSDDSSTNDADLVRLLAGRGVDGLVIVPSDKAASDGRLAQTLSRLPVPFVMVDRLVPGIACDKVGFNNERGGYMATRHLLEAGHERVACIVNMASNTGRERLAGYRRALGQRGLAFDEKLVFESAYYVDAAYEAAGKVLATDATAVFASSDNIALGLLRRLYASELRIPQDYSVVSYDNSAQDYMLGTKLTSVEQNVDELAAATLQILFRRLEEDVAGELGEPEELILTPRLVIHDSVRAQICPSY